MHSYVDQELPPVPTPFPCWPASLTVHGARIPEPVDEEGLDW